MSQEQTQVVETATALPQQNVMANMETMKHLMDVATFMYKANQLPAHLKTPADCLAVTIQAHLWGMSPFAIASQTYSVNGQLAYGAQLVASAVMNSSLLATRFECEWFGEWEKILGKVKWSDSKGKEGKKYLVKEWTKADEEGLGIKVSATIKGENEPRELTLYLSQVQVRNSPLWVEDPRQQIAYLGFKRWSRLYAPEAILGVYTPDELMDSPDLNTVDLNEPPQAQSGAQAAQAAQDQQENSQESALFQKLANIASKQGMIGYGAAWKGLSQDERTAIGIKNHRELQKLAKAYDEANPPIDQEPEKTPPAEHTAETQAFVDAMEGKASDAK